jgi:hypothetical protein
MTATISFEVTVDRHEPSGAFVARSADFPRKVGIGLTEEEAVAELRAHILRPVLQPISPPSPAGNPWAAFADAFRDTPLLAEWKQELVERRQAVDPDREPT